MEQGNVLWENEVESNKALTYTIYVSFGVFSVFWIFAIIGIFNIDIFRISLFEGINAVLMVGTALVARRYEYARPWVKYMLMGVLIFVYASADALYTYNVDILTVIPLITASRYYSKKFTQGVAAVSMCVFIISTLYGANYGLLDLNSLELPPGTVISMGEHTWLDEAIMEIGYDHDRMLLNTIIYTIPVRLGFTLIVLLISGNFSKQGRAMIYKQKELTETTTRVRAELDMASNIQTGILPNDFSAYAGRHEFDLYATMDPAKEVGGDFYDFFLVGEDKLAMVVADVSGKGVPAALFMMQSKTMLKTQLQNRPDPAEALHMVNTMLAEKNEAGMFVTAWVGVLDLTDGHLKYSDAGHERLAVKHNGVWTLLPKSESDMPLALFEDNEYHIMNIDVPYHEISSELTPGDMLFQYTDGVTEATAEDGSMFTEQGLLDALNSSIDNVPHLIINHVRSKINEFVGTADQFDDITMLCMIYHGKSV